MAKSKKSNPSTAKRVAFTKKRVDTTDSNQTVRIRAADYKEIYSNQMEIVYSGHEIKLRILTMSAEEPMYEGKAVLEERAAIIMTHKHLKRFSKVLSELLESEALNSEDSTAS